MNAMRTCGAAVMVAAAAVSAGAQVSKTIPGETKTATATVEAIERSSREVTVKKSDGTYDMFYVPTSVKRFDTLKVGDKITARYYETIVLRVKGPGEKDVAKSASDVVPTSGGNSGTASRQTTITVTITDIKPNVPSVTFTGPRGWTYSSRVEDKQALSKVKVGDKVDITWTEALVVSIDEAK